MLNHPVTVPKGSCTQNKENCWNTANTSTHPSQRCGSKKNLHRASRLTSLRGSIETIKQQISMYELRKEIAHQSVINDSLNELSYVDKKQGRSCSTSVCHESVNKRRYRLKKGFSLNSRSTSFTRKTGKKAEMPEMLKKYMERKRIPKQKPMCPGCMECLHKGISTTACRRHCNKLHK